MTTDSRQPGLYLSAFSDVRHTEQSSHRERFASSLRTARENARVLAGEIPSSLPNFTQHDITHMDALWELADVIAGDETNLNPAEGFVFGAAVLVHDLAMSHAAYTLGNNAIREHSSWPDVLAAKIRADLGRAPSPSEMVTPPAAIAVEAERELLRTLHSESALRLPTVEWTRLDGSKAYLISDPEIRGAYGRLIGKIAASHHWDKSLLSEEFGVPSGAVSWSPPSWTVDSLVLACLLRTADASHIDASRAPDILAHTRHITGESLEHWRFQAKLQRPFLQGDRLVFTAPAGFDRSEIQAWWLAYDVLVMIDEELHGVDNILADNNRTRFRARGVAHVESPRDCRRHLPCNGWEPVAARVQVSDVAGLVQRLGGEGLYGKMPVFGIRELVTNACDAVGALRAFYEYRGTTFRNGRVDVSIESDAAATWLCVADNGIGMTPVALTTALLDFGRSSWLDPVVAADNPGLIASNFEPVGKFGIGFFACFMLGSRVQVISRARSAAPADTWILEFGDGLDCRPTLRRADTHEELDEPGTRVRVLLDESLVSDGAVAFPVESSGRNFNMIMNVGQLADLLPWLLPVSGVDIWTQDIREDRPALVVGANDWTQIDGVELLNRITGPFARDGGPRDPERKKNFERLGPKLEVLYSDEGIPVGRITGLSRQLIEERGWAGAQYSVVTAGSARTASGVNGTVGVLIGKPSRAARDAAVPVLEPGRIASWATEQAKVMAENEASGGGEWVRELAGALHELGGKAGPLRAWHTADGWLDHQQFVDWIKTRTEFFLVHPLYETVRKGSAEVSVNLGPDVTVAELGFRQAMPNGEPGWPRGSARGGVGGPIEMLADALVRAWGMRPEEALDVVVNHAEQDRPIGVHNGEKLVASAHVITKSK